MAIRFACTACRAVMKIGEAIDEPRKVRCKSCGSVILLTPNPADPSGLTASVPKKTDKSRTMSDSRQRVLLLSGLGVLGLILAIGLWWTLSNPSDRGAIEGNVSYDDGALGKGTITFLFEKDGKQISATGPIVQGRYSIRASRGPAIGVNKVEIRGDEDTPIPARYNSESGLSVEVKAGENKENFEVKSK